MKQDMIVILDLGSHENTVLARSIRALGVYSEIYPHDITVEELKALPNVKGIIINGGPNNVIDGVAIDINPAIYTLGIPVMAAGHDKATCEVKLAEFTDDIEAIKAAVKSFVFDTCKAEANWNMKNFVNDQIELIKRQVGDKKVLLALSGGVDSSVVAALCTVFLFSPRGAKTSPYLLFFIYFYSIVPPPTTTSPSYSTTA